MQVYNNFIKKTLEIIQDYKIPKHALKFNIINAFGY